MRINPKHVDWTHITADQVLSEKPCYLVKVHSKTNATGPSTGIIYNGVDVSGEPRLDIGDLQSFQSCQDFNIPMYFDKGMFIDLAANWESCTVGTLPGDYFDEQFKEVS